MPLAPARRACAGFFALNGFVLGMWVVNIPEVLDRTEVTKAELGLLLLVMGGCAVIGMQVGGAWVDRAGSAAVLGVGGVVLAAAVIGPSLATGLLGLALAVVALGATNGLVDVAQNAQAVQVERAFGRPVMSGMHAFFSLGGLAAALLGGALIALGADLRMSLGATAVLGVGATLVARRRLLPPERTEAVERPADVPRAPWSARVVVLGVLAFVLFLAEGTAYDWSTVHVHDSLGASKDVAAWAFGAFSATMTVVRLLADRVVARIGPGAYVRAAALVGAAGLAAAALAPSPPVAIAAWAVFGIGLAGCVPQFFSAAGSVDPSASGTYVARIAGMGYVGLIAGPAAIGLLTTWVDLPTTFWLPAAGCLAAALVAPRVLRPVA